MKSLARPSFFRMFDLLLSTTNTGLRQSRWTVDGVQFEHERHSFTGPRHSLTISIFTLTRPGRRGWSLMVTKEIWWVGPDSKPFKDLRWARHLSGERSDMMAWLRTQEVRLEQSLSPTHKSESDGADSWDETGDTTEDDLSEHQNSR
jgi:hypothetical protein